MYLVLENTIMIILFVYLNLMDILLYVIKPRGRGRGG